MKLCQISGYYYVTIGFIDALYRHASSRNNFVTLMEPAGLNSAYQINVFVSEPVVERKT